jgi:hypothetical protein
MKKMKWLLGIVLSVFVLFLLTSCERQVYVQKDDSFNSKEIRSYAWIAGTDKDSLTQKTKPNDLSDRRIRDIINKNLQANGWRETKRNPDVLLVYDVDIARENRSISDPVYSQPSTRWFFNPYTRRYTPIYYPSQFLGYDNRTETYREGTLTLTVMNADNERTVWQGSTSSEVNGRRMSDKEIEENAKAIIKKLG